MLIVLAVLVALIVLIDGLEIIRRSSTKDVPYGVMFEMVIMKLPHLILEVIPFSILLGGILTFSRLTQTSELIVARAAGISAWQFLAPTLLTSFLIGIMMITIFNPLSATMLQRFEQIEGKHLRGNQSMLAVSKSGLWLREQEPGQPGKTVIHALRVSQKDMTLHDVIIFMFGENNSFVKRIDAKAAQLKNGHWHFRNTFLTAPDEISKHQASFKLPTSLKVEQIQESFASPETVSFWELPGFIDTLQQAGFSALRHVLHWHSILVSPLLFCAMIFIAAAFSLRPPRQGKTGMLMVAGILIGFGIYFLSDLVSAIGLAGKIPIILAAWTPVGISILIGAGLMLHLEDG